MDKEKTGKNKKSKTVFVKFYEDEIETVLEKVKELGGKIGEKGLNGRDIRELFELKPTHRQVGTKGQIKNIVAEMTEEEQKKLLEELKKGE